MNQSTLKHLALQNPAKSTGFTMIEILVALLVLAVGLLGIAGLQTSGMQATLKAHQRAVALNQSQDLADRIRANINGLRSMAYLQTIPTGAPTPDCMTSANTCTNDQLAATDLYNWETNNAALLPSGQGEISCTDIDATTTTLLESGSSCVITVRWDANRDGATGTGCDPTNTGASGDLACMRLRVIP